MASINTIIAVAAGAAVLGTATLVLCGSNKKPSKNTHEKKIPKVESKSQVVAPTKSKPKKKKNKKATKDTIVPTSASAPKTTVAVTQANNHDDEDDSDDDDDDDDDIVLASKSKKPTATATTTKTAPVASSSSSSSSSSSVKPIPAPVAAPAPVVVSAPAPVAAATSTTSLSTTDGEGKKKKPKETPEQKAARLERQKLKDAANESKQTPPATAAAASNNKGSEGSGSLAPSNGYSAFTPPGQNQAQQQPVDGWAVVDKKKPKVALPSTAATADSTAAATADPAATAAAAGGVVVPAAPVLEVLKTQVTIDAKKVGLIVGPKGKTLHTIQDMFKVEIITPKEVVPIVPPVAPRPGVVPPVVTSVIIVQGTSSDSLNKAVRVINDLATKSYSAALEGPDFKEGFIAVPPNKISDLIGKGGAVRRAIETHTDVRMIIPPNVARDSVLPVRVALAGHHEKVSQAKIIINEILDTYHSSVTHPGQVHEELPHVPSALYNQVIGARGSEIKHIQNSYKVSVHIPNADTTHQSIIVVGEPKGVAGAVAHINKIVEKASLDKAAAEIANDAWKDRDQEDQEPQEEWMAQYVRANKLQAAQLASTTPSSTLPGPEETIMTFDSLPTLAGTRSYAGTATSSATNGNGAKVHSAWASVVAPPEGW